MCVYTYTLVSAHLTCLLYLCLHMPDAPEAPPPSALTTVETNVLRGPDPSALEKLLEESCITSLGSASQTPTSRVTWACSPKCQSDSRPGCGVSACIAHQLTGGADTSTEQPHVIRKSQLRGEAQGSVRSLTRFIPCAEGRRLGHMCLTACARACKHRYT